MDKIKRLKELTEQLNQYRDFYYNNSKSLVSDKQYDDLFDELQSLEKETGIIMSNSPTKTVGYEVKSKLEKIKHSHLMLSLDKTKSVDELREFAGNKNCLLSLKMDGLTVLLTYENGELIQAETRGNGEEGEIITHNAKVFDNIPLHIGYLGHLEIEGEAIITYKDFEDINTKLSENEKYKNPRNLVSGSVRQLDSNIAAQRHIKFIAWKVPKIEDYIKSDNSFLFRLQFVKKLGFDIVPFYTYTNISSDSENLDEMIESLKRQAKEKEYPIDGLVMVYDDIAYGESLGMTGHHPKHSLAYKFYDDIYPTELLNVEFTMGKTEILTPTAIFKPVEIDGTSVERASLHNISIMQELGISHKGQIVNVYKANQIIPQIDSVEPDNIKITDENIIIPIEICPICGADTKIIKENNRKVIICTNPDCKGKLLGKLTHFVSKNAINIDGLSEQTLQKFIELGWLNSFQDIYHLSEYKDEMSKLEGFGKRSVEKLLDAIEKSRNITLDRFICAISIPKIGKNNAKIMANKFGNFDNFKKWMYYFSDNNMDDIELSNYEYLIDWTTINGFDEKIHRAITRFISENANTLYSLLDEFIFEESNNTNGEMLNNKIFVITGSLTHYKNRNELISIIESLGGRVSGSVSTKTSFLINNDTESNSSKNRKAKELGVSIISEEDFIKMIS